MKRYAGIGLRIFGIALVVVVLYRIQYRDRFQSRPGHALAGEVVHQQGRAYFAVSGSRERIPLAADWRRDGRVELGLFSIVLGSRKWLLLLFALVYGPISLISITRWWYLLRQVKIRISFWEAFRLTFMGFFFNSAMPGLTGGDLVKAVYIAHHAVGARVKAFMSVLVDRLIGVFALGLLAAFVVAPRATDPRFRGPATIVFLFLACTLAFGILFLSRRLRRFIRYEALLEKLPFSHAIQEIDQAVVIYRRHPKAIVVAVLLSLLNHTSLTIMSIGIGRAIGIHLPAIEFFILVPVCMMMASIPALPGGWGVREGAFAWFFGAAGVPVTMAVALSILIGLAQLAWSLLGGYFFLTRPDRPTARELQAFSHEVEAEVESSEAATSGPGVDPEARETSNGPASP